MLRTVGKVPAILTFVGDFCQGVAAVLLAYPLCTWHFFCWACPSLYELVKAGQYIAGMACVMGHIFPVYYGFRGEKAWLLPRR